MLATVDKCCAVLLAMGGPDSTAGVTRYLYNIFSDRGIIQLPGGALLQTPFALMISRLRAPKVRRHYELIGGSSPLLKWTRAQATHLERFMSEAHPEFRAYVGMRYFPPSIENAIQEAHAVGFRRVCLIPMYPHYCRATTGSSFDAAQRALKALPEMRSIKVNDYHDDPDYIALLKRYITENIRAEETLLYSAHSIPQKFVDEGDPYVEQIKRTAALASGDREYSISFQSRTGPIQWVGPDTVTEVRRLLAQREKRIFLVPISFVCDHVETLYELDIELKAKLSVADVARVRRMPMFNDDPAFAEILFGLIKERMAVRAEI
jgi:ferrochelatase